MMMESYPVESGNRIQAIHAARVECFVIYEAYA